MDIQRLNCSNWIAFVAFRCALYRIMECAICGRDKVSGKKKHGDAHTAHISECISQSGAVSILRWFIRCQQILISACSVACVTTTTPFNCWRVFSCAIMRRFMLSFTIDYIENSNLTDNLFHSQAIYQNHRAEHHSGAVCVRVFQCAVCTCVYVCVCITCADANDVCTSHCLIDK